MLWRSACLPGAMAASCAREWEPPLPLRPTESSCHRHSPGSVEGLWSGAVRWENPLTGLCVNLSAEVSYDFPSRPIPAIFNGGFMRSKILSAVLGLGLLSSSILAIAPAHAAEGCQTAPNSTNSCCGDGYGSVTPGDGGGDSTTPAPAPSPTMSLDEKICRAAAGNNLGSALGPVRTGLKDGGAYRQYQRGFVVYSQSTGAQVSRGAIRTAYGKLGYEKGRLGYPTMMEAVLADITYQKYQGGTITWTSKDGAHALVGAIRAKWEADLWASATLGAPVADEVTGLRAGGATQSFSRGAIVWSSATGAQVSKGAIRTAWLKSGAQNGVLGYPTTGELIDPDGRMMQKFQGGQIVWSARGGAVVFTSTPHSSI
jgi:hypothetical protein